MTKCKEGQEAINNANLQKNKRTKMVRDFLPMLCYNVKRNNTIILLINFIVSIWTKGCDQICSKWHNFNIPLRGPLYDGISQTLNLWNYCVYKFKRWPLGRDKFLLQRHDLTLLCWGPLPVNKNNQVMGLVV